jgi:hypothetical protein
MVLNVVHLCAFHYLADRQNVSDLQRSCDSSLGQLARATIWEVLSARSTGRNLTRSTRWCVCIQKATMINFSEYRGWNFSLESLPEVPRPFNDLLAPLPALGNTNVDHFTTHA